LVAAATGEEGGTMLDLDEAARLSRALADETRLKILDMLSCGELCACIILEAFAISQPTLSYHMWILTDSGLVNARKEGSWIRYTLEAKRIADFMEILDYLSSPKAACICRELPQ
jgi:ArsR family transcriptional regulator, arsenate/arsenite/antimonite-responsive transcriptional repressor